MQQHVPHPLLFRFTLLAIVVLLIASPLRAQSQTPTEVFTAYRAALTTATSYADLLPFMEARGRAMVEAVPEVQRGSMFTLMMRFARTYTEVAVAGESTTGDTAILSLTGKDPKGQPASGSVPMIREAGSWKVGTEKWSSRPSR